MQEATRREALAQPPDQGVGLFALGRADRCGVPLVRLEIVDRHESRLAAHGEAHVLFLQHAVNIVAQRVERGPGFVGERPGDARMLGNAVDAHVELELDIGEACHAGDRSRVAEMRRGGKRHMAFAGQEAGGRVESDPAGARQVDLAPGVQVCEVGRRAGRTIERDDVWLQLDQVPRHEAGRQTEIAQHLHQQPAGIAARSLGAGQRVLGRLHARLEPDDVAGLALDAGIEVDDEVDGVGRRAVDAGKKGIQVRPDRFGLHVDGKVLADFLGIGERPHLRRRLHEEVERIVDRHVGHEVDLDLQLVDRLGEDEAGQEVAVGVLLQVHEMVARRYLQRVAEYLGARMRRRLEADDLRAEYDRPVIEVVREVIDCSENGHGAPILLGDSSAFTFSHVQRILQADIAVRNRRVAGCTPNPLWLAKH